MIQKSPVCLPRSVSRLVMLVFLVILGTEIRVMAQYDDPTDELPYGRIGREIRSKGLRNTAESLVRSQLVSRVGSMYTEETEKQDYRWLERLKIFASIQAEAEVIRNEVILTIDVQELPTVVPFPTLNITNENGVSGGLGARVSSLMHRGIALSGSTKFGGLTEADISLRAPWRLQRREWYHVKYNYRDRVNQQDFFRENSHEFDLRIGMSLYPDWMLSGRFGFTSLRSDIPGITLSPENRDNTPALGFILEYDGRDSLSNPHEGWQGIFDVTQNGGFLGGDGDFVTTQIDIRRYQPIASRHIFAFFLYGTFQSGVVGKNVPVYRDYQIGGTNSVRGWNSDARRGNNQLLNTIEYRYELIPPKTFRVYRFRFYVGLQLAAFADLGTAWSEGSDFTGNMIAGGGVGFRFLVPFLDSIRMDFGFGQSGTGIHPHVHLREKADYSRNRIR